MAEYKEIKELYEYCKTIGVNAILMPYYDGYILNFVRGDFAQHSGTHGGKYGLVEPFIRCKFDFQGVTLEDAKHLVKKYKNELNSEKGKKNNERQLHSN